LKKIFFTLIAAAWALFASSAFAQATSAAEDQPISQPILILFVLFLMSLAPFILMMTTSFVKIAVVLSLTRQALGTQQIPPNQIVTGLALILTIYVMLPVGHQVYDAASEVIHSQDTSQPVLSAASLDMLKKAAFAGKEPVRAFLLKHAHEKERQLFYGLGKKLAVDKKAAEEMSTKDFIVLVPSFVIGELAEAFQIGFVIFLPFLVIDMVVSNILLSMGMFQLSPITISLPFKLLLFVLVDGWYMITKGLVSGYVN
jgi:type III secretion protein R